MTLLQTMGELHSDNFYNPICASGYLTPLQRKKLREKRNISLSPNVTVESEILSKTKKTSKGIKKAKAKRTPKIKLKEKVVKKVLKHKDNMPQLQCSISELVGQNKEGSLKEKKFFKNRSPQHLKKTKFVMPLTSKKELDFISIQAKRSDKSDVKQTSLNKYSVETSSERMELEDNFEACESKSQSKPFNGKVSPISNGAIETKQCTSCEKSSQISEDQIKPECNKSLISIDTPSKGSLDLFEFDWPSDEFLLERENKARATLRESLQPTSKCDSSLENLNETSNSENFSPPKKLFPIFDKSKQKGKEQISKQPKVKKMSLNILDNSKGSEQLIIDAGQKEIGAKMCKTCGMIYTIGQEEDEKLHASYHQTYLVSLKFKGWKKECVVGNYMDGRVIQVKDTDENFGSKKIKDILLIVNRDLGFSTAGLPIRNNVMILLFISNDSRINGCLLAEEIESASCVVSAETSETKSDGKTIWKLGSWYASSETVRAICGVNRIWVSHEFRRRKVASRMVDCLRQCFLYGYIVDMHELAFTDPTVDGREFAASYTGTDNFLVYK